MGDASAKNIIRDQFVPPHLDALQGTVMISGKDRGSGFFINHNGRHLLVTALHLLDKEAKDLKIFWDGGWHSYKCKILGKSEDYDLAILETTYVKSPYILSGKLTVAGLLLGQHVFFLGFPYDLSGSAKIFDNSKRPIPYIKWAGVAALDEPSSQKPNIILDGHNNPGFSGGPVFCNDGSGGQNLCGMITGYKTETCFVDGFSKPVSEDSLVYVQNTGLIYVCQSSCIMELVSCCVNG